MKAETEPGREPSRESSHASDSSHEATASSERASESGRFGVIKNDHSIQLKTIGDPVEAKGEAFFVDGSRYRGTWDALGMAGFGSFRMPHDVIYEGRMADGMQHGRGRLTWPGNRVVEGTWKRGEIKKRKYTFGDGLVYRPDNWTYCRFPDRRFNRSVSKGLNPAGKSLETEDQPTRVIPGGCYDAGVGVFDPSTLCVTNFEKPPKVIGIPKRDEIEWMMDNCRKGVTEPVGYQPRLNENWSPDPPELPYGLPMSTDSPETWWRRIFTFERDARAGEDERQATSRPLHHRINGLSTTVSSAAECPCLCVPEVPRDDVCGGDRTSEEPSSSSASRSQVFREVICEPMSSDDYEGGEVDDLLMTVCVPPGGTYTIMRRKATSARSLETGVEVESSETTIEESSDEERESQEEEEEEEEEDEEGVEEGEEEESEKDSEESGAFEFDDIPYDRSPESSVIGELDSASRTASENESKESSEVMIIEKIEREPSPGRIKRTKVVKQVAAKKQKKKKRSVAPKQPCPSVTDEDQLLQRKVGDLLFSPALEAPRSPVYLVGKQCDEEICTRSDPSKYDSSKCGVSSNNVSKTARKRKPKVCTDSKTNKLSEKMKTCMPSKLFVKNND